MKKAIIIILISLIGSYVIVSLINKKNNKPTNTNFTVSSTDYTLAYTDVELSRRNTIVRTIDKVGPTVININIKKKIYIDSPFDDFFTNDPFFRKFFEDFYNLFPRREYEQLSVGSGFIITPNGYALTNEHVIRDASNIEVILHNQKKYPAKVVKTYSDIDVALIKIEANNLPYAALGNSDNILVGEWVVAIGNPFGLQNTVTVGVISAKERALPGIRGWNNRIYQHMLQTDASINPGNSGGPLVNVKGEVIAINTAIMAQAQGIGFAIPINIAKKHIRDTLS